MKKYLTVSALIGLLLVFLPAAAAGQEESTAEATEAAESLDLQAVCELFQQSEGVEDFERRLNDPETGINNLDLDGNGEVDFIRVVEEAEGDARLVVLQVPVAEDEYQDVAAIEIEKTGEEEYNVQVHGNELIYGPDYYLVPTSVQVRLWPILPRLYRPGYRPYVSVYRFGFYPHWWKPRPWVRINLYRNRVLKLRGPAPYRLIRASRIATIHRIRYTPRHSPRIIKVLKRKPRRKVRRKRDIPPIDRRVSVPVR